MIKYFRDWGLPAWIRLGSRLACLSLMAPCISCSRIPIGRDLTHESSLSIRGPWYAGLWFHLLIHPFPRSVKLVIKVFKVSWRPLVAYNLYRREPMQVLLAVISMCQISVWTCRLVELWVDPGQWSPLSSNAFPLSASFALTPGSSALWSVFWNFLELLPFPSSWPVYWYCANFCVFALFLMFLI